jgi:hypothetical protein
MGTPRRRFEIADSLQRRDIRLDVDHRSPIERIDEGRVNPTDRGVDLLEPDRRDPRSDSGAAARESRRCRDLPAPIGRAIGSAASNGPRPSPDRGTRIGRGRSQTPQVSRARLGTTGRFRCCSRLRGPRPCRFLRASWSFPCSRRLRCPSGRTLLVERRLLWLPDRVHDLRRRDADLAGDLRAGLAQSGNPPALLGDCPSFTYSEIDMENSLP